MKGKHMVKLGQKADSMTGTGMAFRCSTEFVLDLEARLITRTVSGSPTQDSGIGNVPIFSQ